MKKFRYFLSLFLIIFICFQLFACEKSNEIKKETINIIKADGSKVSVLVEIADTPESRQKGYMGREVIPDGTGMLFVFEKSQMLSFWMKNTPHPLSIAFIDSKGKIKNIYDMTPFSEANWSSTDFVQYALEVPQGWFKKVGITVGDIVELNQIKK